MSKNNVPPFKVTSKILALSEQINLKLGQLSRATLVRPDLKLRKSNQIRTVHASLAIEGNTLTIQQITDFLNNKKIVGPKKDILEVKNAIHLYDRISDLDPNKEKDFLKAHQILMIDLIDKPGRYRSSQVGIFKKNQVSKIAPSFKLVPHLMSNLFQFIKNNKDYSFLLKACIFHYEMELIHPFADGNGRMGRLWQQLLLMKLSPVFQYVSVENLIHKTQKEYYKSLETSDKAGESTVFIEYSLVHIDLALTEFLKENVYRPVLGSDRIQMAVEHFNNKSFKRSEYIQFHKTISSATASRDLAEAVKKKIFILSGDKAKALYRVKH